MHSWQTLYPMGTILGDPLPGAPEKARRGNVTTGVRTISLACDQRPDVPQGMKNSHYPRSIRTLQVEVWYPAKPMEDSHRAVYTDYLGRVDLGNLQPYSIPGRAFRDAQPDASCPRPVIVISHGYPGSRILLVNLAENLASKGYVILSIGHTDNTYEDFLSVGSLESALIHRSMDQRFVISQLPHLNSDGFLKGLLLPEQVGLIGFSMGGYGALRTLGAKFSQEALASFASFAEELREPEGFKGLDTVKAAVLFAPATFWFDPDASEDLCTPTLWICGTADRTVYYDRVRAFCEKAVHSDRIFLSYAHCGHNIANNPAPPQAQSSTWEIQKRWADPVWDTWRLNNLNAHFVTAFMDLHLKKDTVSAVYLESQPMTEKIGNQTIDCLCWKGFVDGRAEGVSLNHWPAIP